MPVSTPQPPEVTSVRAYCLRVLEAGDLATKLSAPTGSDGQPLPDIPTGPSILDIDRPVRGPGLGMEAGSEALPAPGALQDIEARRICLARFAHHELQAVELFAWALLRWPDAPTLLRRGLLSALVDEQRHCRLYLARLAASGGRFDTDDHSDYFWRQAPAMAESPAGIGAFLAGMGLTLEQANLDFTLTYRDAFAEAGDEESAAVCQQVHDDEIAHVALALRWLERLAKDATGRAANDLERYLEVVPFPLGPTRAKGRRFEVPPRRQAGLSDAFIEHVRTARVQERDAAPITLVPNLGAEEGGHLEAYRAQPAVRTAAHLWSLLFARRARLEIDPEASTEAPGLLEQAVLWPPDLGPPPSEPVFSFLAGPAPSAPGRTGGGGTRFVWYATERALAKSPPAAAVPDAKVTRAVHDKAFAARVAREEGLQHRSLDPLIEILEPDALRDADRLVTELTAQLGDWPEWTGGRFTLKPRFGSSGRGRAGGTGTLDTPKIRGALPRLADRGGAIFEPWLDRVDDFSTSLYVPAIEEAEAPIVLLGSTLLWTSASGVYRGHCGEVDSRGRVFSGDPEDERLRADAAMLAARARTLGFSGPCGVDGFRYRVGEGEDGDEGEEAILRTRSAVEFNARPTMGLVAIGLVRRALARVRKRLEIRPGDRAGFALSYRPGRPANAAEDESDAVDHAFRRRIYEEIGNDAVIVDLARASLPGDPRASLVFARDPEAIRAARRSLFDC